MRWKRYTNYRFAASDSVCSLVIDESPRAMLCQPLAFVCQQGSFTLVSVQGLGRSDNLLVDSSGAWRTGYVPARYRAYPFFLSNAMEGPLTLCVDEGSGLLISEDKSAELFFNSDGSVSHSLTQVLDFLKQIESSRLNTVRACGALSELELFEVWPIALAKNTEHLRIDGFYRINEKALSRLPGGALEKLRDVGALSLAYCQLLSMQHLPGLVSLLDDFRDSSASMADIEFSLESGNLDLSNI